MRCSRRSPWLATALRSPSSAWPNSTSRSRCCAAQSALYDGWARNYTGGAAGVALGHIIRQPDLARTLEALATNGRGYLYGGALGRDDRRPSGKARRMPYARRSRGRQADLERAADRDLSRPHRQHSAAAVRGLPVPADAAHPRRLRSRQAGAQRRRASRHRLAGHPARGRRAHRQQ